MPCSIMELDAQIKYGNGKACFRIHRENPGIYYAHLVYSEGEDALLLPENITLVRGVRQWTGSHDDPELLNELGRAIEELHHRLSFSPTRSR